MSAAARAVQPFAHPREPYPGDCRVFHFDLRAAVRDEPRHLMQKAWNSFGAAVMAAFAAAVKIDTFAHMPVQDFGNAFSIHRAELRCGQAGTHPQGIERCGSCIRCVLRDCVRLGVRVRKAAYAAVCGSGRNGDYRRGRALPALRRVLLRHWLLILALRAVPCGRKARYERGADGHLARYARGAGISFIRCHRSYRHLVVGADRLVPR